MTKGVANNAEAATLLRDPLNGFDRITLVKAGIVTDGPYVEAKEVIASFSIIQADNYDAAVAIARECPPGHIIEIRELAGYA